MADNPDKPKIVVDDDWKAQAQAEKEKLAQQVDKKSAPKGSAAGPAEQVDQSADAGPRELPPANFATLVSFLAAQVFMALGGYQDPQSGKRYVDLALAKHHIDSLSVLEEKTRGNLSDDEKKLLDHALYEIRMQYVQITQHLSQL